MSTYLGFTNDELIKGIYAAAAEYKNLIGKSYLLIGKNKTSSYFWFQCDFEKKHFMHLIGINSKTLSANEFFELCDLHNMGLNQGIRLEDCTPSRNHSRKTVNEKILCSTKILHIQDAKYMKIGIKDKLSQYVDFTYAFGYTSATLGFHDNGNGSSFPISLIPKNIDEFSSQKYKIIFVLEKSLRANEFSKLIVEIKDGVFAEHYEIFPRELKNKISVA